ncbi:MAG: cell division protein ZapA [Alphaproteobacteria bacterium]|jgi:cell division protein ZapA|nr:cell division protein ZapA [Alphaproteobacteria bacterium]
MAQIKVHINGRSYDVACDDGQEEHVLRLGRYVDKKVGELANQIGQVGDTRLLVMAALVITDELSEAYGELEDIREGKAGVVGAGGGTSPADARAAEDIRALVRRIESIARSLEGA